MKIRTLVGAGVVGAGLSLGLAAPVLAAPDSSVGCSPCARGGSVDLSSIPTWEDAVAAVNGGIWEGTFDPAGDGNGAWEKGVTAVNGGAWEKAFDRSSGDDSGSDDGGDGGDGGE